MKKIALIIFLGTFIGLKSQSTGDYRSAGSGTWNIIGTWERYNGSAWVTPGASPTSTDGVITIRSGHTVDITAAVTIDQIVIESGGTLVHNGAGTVTLNDGTGTDLQINGTWRRTINTHTISISGSANINVGSGGVYELNISASGGSVPTASWDNNSTLRIMNNAAMSSAPSNMSTQVFGKVEINLPNQSSFWTLDFSNIVNELSIVSTGTGHIIIQSNKTMTGNYSQNGGAVVQTNNNSANDSFKLSGNFELSGGTYTLNDGTQTNNFFTALIVGGKYKYTGGTFNFPSNSTTKNAGRIFVRGDSLIINNTFGGFLSTGTIGSGIYVDGGSISQTLSIGSNTSAGSLRNAFYYKTTGGPSSINEIYNGATAQSTISGTFSTPASGYSRWDTTTTGSILSNLVINNANGVELRNNGRRVNGTLYRTAGSITGTGIIAYASGASLFYNGTAAMTTADKEFPSTNGPTNLVINNAGNITLHANRTIRGNLNFLNGKLFTDACVATTSSADSSLTLADNATVTGADSARFVDGILKKTGDDAFTFPIGSGSKYAPVGITAPLVNTDRFAACYIGSNPNSSYSIASKAGSLNTVSKSEYWHINRENGSSNANVTLSWDSRSGGITNMSLLRVCRWNGSQWDDESNTGTTGSNISGTVTSGSLSSFSPFTLGSTSSANPLPVELLYFKAICQDGKKLIQWATASETNSSHFKIAKSSDARIWTDIGRVDGHGNSPSQINYEYVDVSSVGGNYYRLYQEDSEGGGEFLKVVYIETKDCQNDFGIYFDDENQCLRWYGKSNLDDIDMSIKDMLGREVYQPSKVDLGYLPAGIYYLRSQYRGETIQFGFRKR